MNVMKNNFIYLNDDLLARYTSSHCTPHGKVQSTMLGYNMFSHRTIRAICDQKIHGLYIKFLQFYVSCMWCLYLFYLKYIP